MLNIYASYVSCSSRSRVQYHTVLNYADTYTEDTGPYDDDGGAFTPASILSIKYGERERGRKRESEMRQSCWWSIRMYSL